MKLPDPQLEFVDLLSGVLESTPMVLRQKSEQACMQAKLRREEKRAESELRLAWADWYEALGSARMENCQHAAAVESFQRAMEMVPARKHLREPIAFGYICMNELGIPLTPLSTISSNSSND